MKSLLVYASMFVSGTVACGGSESKPAESAEGPPSLAHSDGGAVEGDLYAAFDGGALEQAADDHAANNGGSGTVSNGDIGAECQAAASAWEKRARPEIKACYREGKKKDPNLMGTARILVDVGGDGKTKPAKLDGISSLGDDVATCMVKAVSKTAFPDASACRGRQLTLPIEFPTPVKPK